jgi:hypothetical protein
MKTWFSSLCFFRNGSTCGRYTAVLAAVEEVRTLPGVAGLYTLNPGDP